MFTFKCNKSTGRYRSFKPDSYDIKIKKKICGHIYEAATEFKASFAIKKEETKENPAPFKWVYLKTTFGTFEEMKTHLQFNFNKLTEKLDLYYFEDLRKPHENKYGHTRSSRSL